MKQLIYNIYLKIFCCLFVINGYAINPENRVIFGGRLFIDGGSLLKDKDFRSQLDISDLRLSSRFLLKEGWSTKLDLGFAYNKLSVKDAFIQKKTSQHLLRFGYMLGMFSLEQSSSTNDLLFINSANIAETLSTGRRIGFSYTLIKDKYYLSAGCFYGDINNLNIRSGINSTLRIVYKPIKDNNRLLHLGTGIALNQSYKLKETNTQEIHLESSIGTNSFYPCLFDFKINNSLFKFQYNIELILKYYKLFVQTEYLNMIVNRIKYGNVRANGGYLECAYFIKGSNLNYDENESLITCDDVKKSIALIGRINVTNFNHLPKYLGVVFDISLGVNYYMNRNVILRLNGSFIKTDRFNIIPSESLFSFQSRIQVKF